MKNYEDTENRILGNLLRTPLESKSLHQIAIQTELSYVTVHKLIPNLIKKGLIKVEKKGKANLASIDFENAPLERISSAMISEKSRFIKKHPQITILSRDIEEALTGEFYILLLFGSYAKEKSKKESDIDLLFIIPDKKNIEKYKNKLNKALRISPIKKHTIIVSSQDFTDMLNQKYSVGRAAFQEGIVLFGADQYYSMVKTYVKKKGY